MCKYCIAGSGGTVTYGYDLGLQKSLSKEGKYGLAGAVCKCPCSPWMKEQFLKNVDATYGPRRWQWRRKSLPATGCHNCHHEVGLIESPMPEDQVKLLKMKIRNASLVLAGGVGIVLCGLALLAYGGMRQGPSMLWLYFSMCILIGTAVAFAGLDALVFGYKTLQEQIEEMGRGETQ
jgi:hypothetical protein